jgi:hypothetical protein
MKARRNKTVQLRVSEAELEQIEASAAAAERSVSSFLHLLVKAAMGADDPNRQQAA